MKYDLAVIGGGLAGLALALDVRRRGYSVMVIEKGAYPRHKVCGEYISLESQRYLHSLCPALKTLKLPVIEKFKLTSTGGKDFITELGLGGFGISRYLLEELLYKEALEQGIVFLLETKALQINTDPGKETYTITTTKQPVAARLVCNASGRRSNLEMMEKGKKEVSTNYIGIKYHVRLPRDQRFIEIHNFPGGYCGISDIEDGKSCLCYIVNAEKLQAVNRSIPELEKKILSANTALQKIFSQAEFLLKEPCVISGINFRIKEPFNGTAFFLGDSAGSIAPITGNGMSIGLRSALVLAGGIGEYLSGKITKQELEKQYTTFWNQEFSARIRLSRSLQKLSEFPALTRMTITLFRLCPPLARGLIKLTHGKPF